MHGMVNDDSEWRALIEAFVEARIDGPTFERLFLDMRTAEIDRGLSQRYAVDLLFYEVDAYCADPTLFGPDDIDEEQLRIEAKACLVRWEAPWPEL